MKDGIEEIALKRHLNLIGLERASYEKKIK